MCKLTSHLFFFADGNAEKIEEHSELGGQLNMKAVFLHVLGDALGSVVVLVSALTIYFVEVGFFSFEHMVFLF